MKTIPLTHGFITVVDDSDYPSLAQFHWHLARGRRTNYAARGVRVNGKMKRIYLHRQLLGVSSEVHLDHQDGDGLNNQRTNLRPATRAQQSANSPKVVGRTSQFKGVSRALRPVGWKAHIRAGGKVHHLGYFKDEQVAARAYDQAARLHFGEFARPNFLS